MNTKDEVLSALQKAVELSPESGALRRHYAEMLLNRGFARDAELEFRKAIELSSSDAEARLGLARALQSQGQHSTALFLVKQVIRESNRPAKAYVLYARLLLVLGSVEKAVTEYRKALDADPKAQDPDLEAHLGLGEEEATARDRSTDIPPEGLLFAEEDVPSRPPWNLGGLEELEEAVTPPEAGAAAGFSDALRQLFSPGARLSFQDVGGLDAIKEEIGTMLLHPLNHRDFYRAYHKKVGGRVLLYGPPGCGKTHLARSMAGEVLAPFLAVGLHTLRETWEDESPRVLHEIFDRARQQNPWVLLFDDVQRVGRGGALVRRFLAEIAGSEASNDGLLILAATSAPWDVDPQLLAAGIYERIFFLPPPQERDRSEILRILCRGKPQGSIDFDELARRTEGFSCENLHALVERAVEAKLQRSLEEGRPNPLTTEDLLELTDFIPTRSKEWFDLAREHLATHPPGGDDLYADLRAYLEEMEAAATSP